jgi:hypothetical protein
MKVIWVSVLDCGVIVVPSSVRVVPVKPEPVSVTCVPPAIGPCDGLMEVIVACAVDAWCGDAENFSAERATIASIASAAKMRAALYRN